jgi:hypothetical protein
MAVTLPGLGTFLLPLLLAIASPVKAGVPANLDNCYQAHIISRSGAFIYMADYYHSFDTVVLTQLVKEIAAWRDATFQRHVAL